MKSVNISIIALSLILAPLSATIANAEPAVETHQVASVAPPSEATAWSLRNHVVSGIFYTAKIAALAVSYNPSLVAWALSCAGLPTLSWLSRGIKAAQLVDFDSPKSVVMLKILDAFGYGDYARNTIKIGSIGLTLLGR